MGTRPGAQRGGYVPRAAKTIRRLAMDHGYPVPDLPPVKEWTDYEQSLWAAYWQSPQAACWGDELRPVVAALVTLQAKQMVSSIAAHESKFVADTLDSLGVTPTAMARLGWELEDD
ncbi:hypothetical protein [Streptomyces wuyuanensis]|uniref:Uncharacterized protein n=1 Tax=Streptomyces wuyuanensis TaxID=1196353 RepID=A0A1G9WMA8_9ACTN|nr:hypothetical protein [Streptomyces wuyuanensis]SDM85664.1 hypothetical protein SAMN05444921_11490 [Streptomyces wuyuanensis]